MLFLSLSACVRVLVSQNVYQPNPSVRWFEAEEETTLFTITKQPLTSDAFIASGDVRWGRTPSIESLATSRGEGVITVDVVTPGQEALVPRIVTLSLSYYQVTTRRKRLIFAEVGFDAFCTTSDVPAQVESFALQTPPILPCADDFDDRNYTLQFSYEPLSYLELLNQFEFTADVYIAFFILMGLLIVLVGAVVWAVNRILTKLRHPPRFRWVFLRGCGVVDCLL